MQSEIIFLVPLLDLIIFWDPVVLESICYRTRANRLINESKTTGWLRKIWTGSSSPGSWLRRDAGEGKLWSSFSFVVFSTNFFLRSSCNRVNLLSYESKPTYKREQYDCVGEKNLDGSLVHRIFEPQYLSCSTYQWFVTFPYIDIFSISSL